jgi:hypothetical protein
MSHSGSFLNIYPLDVDKYRQTTDYRNGRTSVKPEGYNSEDWNQGDDEDPRPDSESLTSYPKKSVCSFSSNALFFMSPFMLKNQKVEKLVSIINKPTQWIGDTKKAIGPKEYFGNEGTGPSLFCYTYPPPPPDL